VGFHSDPLFIALTVMVLGVFLGGRVWPYLCAQEKELWFLLAVDVSTRATLFGLPWMWYIF
jgi:hypothetical protein